MQIYEKLIDLYEKELKIPFNDFCSDCDALHKAPLLPWVVGENYFTPEGRIYIAGKPHRVKSTEDWKLRNSMISDGRERGYEFFLEKKWAYWRYTRDLLNTVFGSIDEGWKHIAFSNIIKCSSSNKNDNTSRLCAKQCIVKNQVVIKEIELLQPRKIIFYTWSLFRHLFEEVPFAEDGTVINNTNINYRVRCGEKNMGWWDRSITAKWGEKVDFLILAHPERMNKVDYISRLSEWLSRP